MDSKIDTPFSSTIIRTESSDTRLGVKRDEAREENRKKKEDKPEEENETFGPDRTVISIPALKALLESLISPPAVQATTTPTTTSAPAPTRASNAARAYQTTARTTEPEAAASPPPQAQSSTPSRLSAEELQQANRLLADLAFLTSHKIESLEIELGENFLQSLINAAATARAKL